MLLQFEIITGAFLHDHHRQNDVFVLLLLPRRWSAVPWSGLVKGIVITAYSQRLGNEGSNGSNLQPVTWSLRVACVLGCGLLENGLKACGSHRLADRPDEAAAYRRPLDLGQQCQAGPWPVPIPLRTVHVCNTCLEGWDRRAVNRPPGSISTSLLSDTGGKQCKSLWFLKTFRTRQSATVLSGYYNCPPQCWSPHWAKQAYGATFWEGADIASQVHLVLGGESRWWSLSLVPHAPTPPPTGRRLGWIHSAAAVYLWNGERANGWFSHSPLAFILWKIWTRYVSKICFLGVTINLKGQRIWAKRPLGH